MKKIFPFVLIFLLVFSGATSQHNEILNLKEKIIELQNDGILGFENFTLCSTITTFASYVPLLEPVIKKNGTLLLYYEPLNIFTKKQDGMYEIWYTQDMILMSKDGKVLAEWKDILEFHHWANKPVMDLFAQNTVDLEGLPSGKYKFEAVLKDQLRGTSATKVIDFEIR